MKALIQKLTQITGPSGHEENVRNLVHAEIQGHCDDIRQDALGNLIAVKGKKSAGGQRVMLAAHMDEIGVIATHIDDNGFVRFAPIGGVYPVNSLYARMRFINGVEGVVGCERLASREINPTIEQLYIDVGAESRRKCPVGVGDMAVFERPFLDLGERVVSKAMDDRVGVAILVETLRQLKNTPNEVIIVFTTQEEVGPRGAQTAAYHVDPDIGISVDVTLCGDLPKGIKMEVALGKGPAIKVRDGGMLSDPRLVDLMVRTARKAKLPYQLEVLEGGTTDAKVMQVSRAGMPAGCLSIPCRYVHSASEMVDMRDVNNAVQMLVALLGSPLKLER